MVLFSADSDCLRNDISRRFLCEMTGEFGRDGFFLILYTRKLKIMGAPNCAELVPHPTKIVCGYPMGLALEGCGFMAAQI